MKIVCPDFYNDFKCTASACSDSCCIGWEVDIDPFTMSIYDAVEGDFGRRLRENIARGDCDRFILKGERCPFLNGNNLCDIFINLGEDKLCDICSDHPRFYEWYGDRTEKGLGLCCEEVCRLLFTKSDKLSFITEETDDEDEDVDIDPEEYDRLFAYRQEYFDLLQDRSKPLEARVLEVLSEDDSTRDGTELLAEVLDVFLSLESIDPIWRERLNYAREHINELPQALDCDRDYEHFLVYLFYRYYLKGAFDLTAAGKFYFIFLCFIALRAVDLATLLMKGEFGFEDRILNAKGFSKDVEYSQDNLEAVEAAAAQYILSDSLAAVINYIF